MPAPYEVLPDSFEKYKKIKIDFLKVPKFKVFGNSQNGNF